jgi:hypothetical protein
VKNLAVKVVDRLFIVACGATAPTGAEWAAYLDLVKHHGVDRTMQIVRTDGGGPMPAQRRELDKVLAGRIVPMAVLSESIRVRWGMTVASWFSRHLRAFRPSELGEALAFLEIPASRADLIERELCRLRQEVERDPLGEHAGEVARLLEGPSSTPLLEAPSSTPRSPGPASGKRRTS